MIKMIKSDILAVCTETTDIQPSTIIMKRFFIVVWIRVLFKESSYRMKEEFVKDVLRLKSTRQWHPPIQSNGRLECRAMMNLYPTSYEECHQESVLLNFLFNMVTKRTVVHPKLLLRPRQCILPIFLPFFTIFHLNFFI